MHEFLILGLFFAFSALVLSSALMVILQKNPVRAVLWLVLSFLGSAVLWLLMQAEFLALILVLVYVGAVMTLFLFVIMMLHIHLEEIKSNTWRFLPVVVLVISGLVALVIKVLPNDWYTEAPTLVSVSAEHLSNTEMLGLVLYTDYLAAFELAAVILLVAIVSAITITHKSEVSRSKRQLIKNQIMTKKTDRLTIVSMNAEKGEDE